MSINVCLFLVVLTFFAVESLAKPNIDEGFDWFSDHAGMPSSSSSRGKADCIKDLLLVVDMSYSIGQYSFERDVKPFLVSLVQDPTLNVDRDGTQIAMIIFSQMKKTKQILKFGEIYDKQELSVFINHLDWRVVSGDRTRTDLALEIANDKVFPVQSPGNNRPTVDDVVVILTDGKPSGAWDAKENAIKNAGSLKEKDIIVIGAAVGPSRKQFLDILWQIATSPKYTVDADFKDMDKVIGKLVASSCTKPGECTCKSPQPPTSYVKPGDSEAEVRWLKPTYECWSGRAAELETSIVDPPVISPHAFSVGKHTITYTYKLKGGVDVVCAVNLEVKGELCRGIAFTSKTQVCCCGVIYERKVAHDCCGTDYYNISLQRCCPNSNLISEEKSCPSA